MTLKKMMITILVLPCTLMVQVQAQDYRELDWLDLLPENERTALMSRPPIDHSGGDVGGSGPALGEGRSSAPSDSEYSAAWQSTNIVGSFNNERVQLPGFVVPLEYDGEQRVTEFFLVPYFGACIHTPPPPPNQIIHVEVEGGLDLPGIQEPYIVRGVMTTEMTHDEIGISAYSIEAEDIVRYRE